MVGMMAPVLLVFLRLIQGVAASGEYPGAICFLTELAPPNRKGLWGSMCMLGVSGGILLGSIISSILTSTVSNNQLYSWGWRIPFLMGLPLGLVGWYMRYKVRESEIFKSSAQLTGEVYKLPIRQIMQFDSVNLIKVIVLFSLGSISFYLGFVYIETYLVNAHKITLHEGLINNVISIIVLILLTPIFGYLSDRINRKYIIVTGATCLLIFYYPIFLLFLTNSHGLLLGQCLLATFLAMFVGPLAVSAAEIFPTLTRYSGVSAGLNIGASIFGGTCPLIATYLVYYSGVGFMPCIYPMLFALIVLLVMFRLKRRSNYDIALSSLL